MAIQMTHKSIFILGRQPAIGRAELESLLGAEHLEAAGDQAVISDITPSDIPFGRLGGSIRLAKILTPLSTTQWPEIAKYLIDTLPKHLGYLPEGKLKLGLSCFGLPINERQLLRTGLELKKVCKQVGRSVRLVPNTESALSSASVLHNNLTDDLGMELLLVKDGKQTWLAQTTQVQDIEAYARRDQKRPKRDARVGMLPPKLAQIIVNLAGGQNQGIGAGMDSPDGSVTVLDPFCGTGVILQESMLMGYNAYGTDLEQRMIDFSEQNLTWLKANYPLPNTEHTLEAGDATTYQWTATFTTVASETYLGRPLSSWPSADTLSEIMSTCNLVIEKFLKNLAPQTNPGFRMCLAVPVWRGPHQQFHHLKMLDHLERLGYNRVRFKHSKDDDLIYYRPEQIVGRELLILERI